MKFYYGEPPEVQLQLQNPTSLLGLTPDRFNLIGGAIGVGLAALLVVLGPGFSAVGDAVFSHELWQLLVATALLVVVHELLHLIGYGGLAPKSRVSFGFHPKLYIFYTFNPVAVSKRRFVCAVAMPFVALTVVPTILALSGAHYSVELVTLATLNAVGAGGDLILLALTFKAVPNDCHIQSSGMGEFWGVAVPTVTQA